MRTVSIVEIAKEAKVKPTVARRKLRAAFDRDNKGARWEFTSREVPKIKKLIKA